MKKNLTAIAISIVLLAANTSTTLAQLTIQPQAGYQWSLAGGLLAENYNSSNFTSSGVYGSYGQGAEVGLDVQYKFCTYLNLDLGLRYWAGSAIKFSNSEVVNNDSIETSNSQNNLHMIVLSLGEFHDFSTGNRFAPFLGFGLDCAVDDNIKSTISVVNYPSPGVNSLYGQTTKNDIAFGGYGELGVKYHIGSHLSILGEVRFDVLSLTPTTTTINSYTVDGVNKLGSLSLVSIETVYEKSIPESYYYGTSNPNEPTEELAYTVPASAWGFNVGVAYSFGTWTKAAGTK